MNFTRPVRYGSLFSGAGGFDLGFDRAGLECAWQVEIDPVCQAVLSHHWPEVPKHLDIREVGGHNLERVDVICGGSPCQNMSAAGDRSGVRGEQSGLFFEFARVCAELQPELFVWENVAGALSSNSGRDFAEILHTFRKSGYREVGWRCANSRYWGVAQFRERVFVVGSLRAHRAFEVLFIEGGVPGDDGKSGTLGEEITTQTSSSFRAIPSVVLNGPGGKDLSHCLRIKPRTDATKVSDRASVLGSSSTSSTRLPGDSLVINGELDFARTRTEGPPQLDPSMMVRRIMPVEGLRLQSWPDNWLDVEYKGKPLSNAARYKMIGNGVTANVGEWWGKRILNSFQKEYE